MVKDKHRNSFTITEKINAKAFELLERNPQGIRWKDLLSKIQETSPSFHPKTINGCIWKLTQNFSNKVYKPSPGVFCLLKNKKYKSKTSS